MISRRYARGALILAITLVFAGACKIFPDLVSPSTLTKIAGFLAGCNALLIFFFNKFLATSGVGQLSGRELDHYNVYREELRGRFWLLVGLLIAGSGMLYVLAISDYAQEAQWLPWAAGFLIGSCLSFLLVGWKWLDAMLAFADKLALKEQRKRDHEAAVKRLATG